MSLDDALPCWHHGEHHRIGISAPADVVLGAAEQVTWREVPVFKLLMTVRTLGKASMPDDSPVLALFTDMGFVVLQRTDHELVVGGIRRPALGASSRALPISSLLAFHDFDEAGHIKIGFDFRYADDELSTETRVLGTDPRSLRRFAVYWLIIRPGSGLIRHIWLRAIRRRALKTVGMGIG